MTISTEKLAQIMELSPELRAHRLRLLTIADMEWLVTQVLESDKPKEHTAVTIEIPKDTDIKDAVEEVKSIVEKRPEVFKKK